jgi:hypothetical protein
MRNKTQFFGPIPPPEKLQISVNKINFYDIDESCFYIMDRFIDDWGRLNVHPCFKYDAGSRLDEDQWLMLMSDVYSMYDFRYRKRVINPAKPLKESDED